MRFVFESNGIPGKPAKLLIEMAKPGLTSDYTVDLYADNTLVWTAKGTLTGRTVLAVPISPHDGVTRLVVTTVSPDPAYVYIEGMSGEFIGLPPEPEVPPV